MSKEKLSKEKLISMFGEKAKKCKSDDQKVAFFDSHRGAFFIDSNESTFSVKENIPKDLDDAFYVYANMKRMNEKDLEVLKNLSWNNYPRNFKIFLFDFCILNGVTY